MSANCECCREYEQVFQQLEIGEQMVEDELAMANFAAQYMMDRGLTPGHNKTNRGVSTEGFLANYSEDRLDHAENNERVLNQLDDG